MKKKSKNFLLKIIIVIPLIYFSALAFLFFIQRSLLYHPNVNNYYRISLYLHTSGDLENEDGDLENIKKEYPLELFSNDPSFSQGIPWDGYSFSGRRVFFSDDLFNGTQKEISFDFDYKINILKNSDNYHLIHV